MKIVGPERKGPYVTFCVFWDNWRNEFSISKSIIGVNIKTNGALKTLKQNFNFQYFKKFPERKGPYVTYFRAKRALCDFFVFLLDIICLQVFFFIVSVFYSIVLIFCSNWRKILLKKKKNLFISNSSAKRTLCDT